MIFLHASDGATTIVYQQQISRLPTTNEQPKSSSPKGRTQSSIKHEPGSYCTRNIRDGHAYSLSSKLVGFAHELRHSSREQHIEEVGTGDALDAPSLPACAALFLILKTTPVTPVGGAG